MPCVFSDPSLLALIRQKVDLTKYIEEHQFNFDNCFDSDADNQRVSKVIIAWLPSISHL